LAPKPAPQAKNAKRDLRWLGWQRPGDADVALIEATAHSGKLASKEFSAMLALTIRLFWNTYWSPGGKLKTSVIAGN
jgi:hypothetical protein